jgi:diguanylate cyclase (GGDEF)-like protein
MVDLDNFKAVNDTLGHPVGDEVLRDAAKRLTGRIRPYDELGRYGGEEFLAVLPGCSLSCAFDVAERMRQCVGTPPISTSAGLVTLTASFGVASVHACAVAIDALVTAADQALYRAKRAGRNRVEGPEPAPQPRSK